MMKMTGMVKKMESRKLKKLTINLDYDYEEQGVLGFWGLIIGLKVLSKSV